MKILAVVGSLREGSLNKQLAEAAAKYLNSKADVQLLEYEQVPLFNEDLEFPAPKAVSEVRKKVKESDGIWFFTPEYNHFFSGVMKNLLDWLSRPISAEEGSVLPGKPAAFSGISPATGGTANAQDHLVTLLSYLNMTLMNSPRLAIPNALSQLQDKQLVLESSRPFLEKQADAFVKFIENQNKN